MCRLRNIALESVTDGQTDRRTDRQTDRRTTDKVIPMCRYDSVQHKKPLHYSRDDKQTVTECPRHHQFISVSKNTKFTIHPKLKKQCGVLESFNITKDE